jgi:methylated-DNA-protein-cysteine methyltransferase-like protein
MIVSSQEWKSMKFKERVYRVVADIPPGRVMTYGQVAELAGSPGAARAVGSAMARNPRPGSGPGRVPCHRVVKSDGSLGGFSSKEGPPEKKRLLEKEGIGFKSGKIKKNRYIRK